MGQQRKACFFEKKSQKTFDFFSGVETAHDSIQKFFASFFQKRRPFLFQSRNAAFGTGTLSFRLQCAAFVLLLGSFVVPRLLVTRTVFDVIVVLDITGSMNARDQMVDGVAASRLTVEKRAALALLGALPCGSRLGVAIFVEERPFMLFAPTETCENFAPLAQAIGAIDWREGWDSESHIAAGLKAAIMTAHDLGADLVFMTDGQEMPPLAWSAPPNFSALRNAVGGLLVGVGGRAFVEIPKFDRNGHEIGVWKPGEVPSETGGMFKGHEYLTAVDEPHLRALAADSGLNYIHLDTADGLPAALKAAVRPRLLKGEAEIRWIPASLSLLILGAGFFPARRIARGIVAKPRGRRRIN